MTEEIKNKKSTETGQPDLPKKASVLIVEDEVHLATGMRYSLERENYDVEMVHDGPAALELVTNSPKRFDVIILDIMLPGMNGYAICEKIREQDILTPIMFLSVRTLPEDRAKGFAVGANQYMAKPFELEEFLARIQNMLLMQKRQMESAQSNAPKFELDLSKEKVLEIGRAKIDFQTLEVETPEGKNRLTALEMSLLAYFVENPDRLIPKEELLENVWKMPRDLNTRAPDQFLLRLRKIFEPDPTNPIYFLTYRNAGYRYVSHPEENR